MSVTGVMGWLNIRGIRVEVDLPDEVYCAVETIASVRLINCRRLPSFVLTIKLCGSEIPCTILPRRGNVHHPMRITFDRRGTVRIGRVAVCSPFPVNFFVRCHWQEVDQEVVVFPRPVPCGAAVDRSAASRHGELPVRERGYDGDLLRIGDYTGGEPLKHVHWRLSARHDTLKVKELSVSTREPVLLDLAAFAGRGTEEALSCLAYLVNRYQREQRPVGLRLDVKTIPPAVSRSHRIRLLTELAQYGQG